MSSPPCGRLTRHQQPRTAELGTRPGLRRSISCMSKSIPGNVGCHYTPCAACGSCRTRETLIQARAHQKQDNQQHSKHVWELDLLLTSTDEGGWRDVSWTQHLSRYTGTCLYRREWICPAAHVTADNKNGTEVAGAREFVISSGSHRTAGRIVCTKAFFTTDSKC